MLKQVVPVAAIVVLACGVGCRRDSADYRGAVTPRGPAAAASRAQPSVPAPDTTDQGDIQVRQAVQSAVTAALQVKRADGGGPVDFIRAGDAVVAEVKAGAVEPGTSVKVVWLGPGEQKEAETQATISKETPMVTSNPGDTSGWSTGPHVAEVWVGGARVASSPFVVSPNATAMNE